VADVPGAKSPALRVSLGEEEILQEMLQECKGKETENTAGDHLYKYTYPVGSVSAQSRPVPRYVACDWSAALVACRLGQVTLR
jgi:hypothetical protein